MYVRIYHIYVSVLQYLVFHFCTFISLFSSLLLCATCIFHWVHPWIASDSGTNGRSPALRIVKPLYEKRWGEGVGGVRYRESPFWLEGFELNLHFQLPFQFHRPRSVPLPLPSFPLRFHCVGVSIYCEILKLYKEYLNKTQLQRRSRRQNEQCDSCICILCSYAASQIPQLHSQFQSHFDFESQSQFHGKSHCGYRHDSCQSASPVFLYLGRSL